MSTAIELANSIANMTTTVSYMNGESSVLTYVVIWLLRLYLRLLWLATYVTSMLGRDRNRLSNRNLMTELPGVAVVGNGWGGPGWLGLGMGDGVGRGPLGDGLRRVGTLTSVDFPERYRSPPTPTVLPLLGNVSTEIPMALLLVAQLHMLVRLLLAVPWAKFVLPTPCVQLPVLVTAYDMLTRQLPLALLSTWAAIWLGLGIWLVHRLLG